MAWTVRYSNTADKALRKLDKQVVARVLDYMDTVAALENPRSKGKNLTGNLSGLWQYRVGDYRVVCDIEDNVLVVLVVDVEHRSTVYKR